MLEILWLVEKQPNVAGCFFVCLEASGGYFGTPSPHAAYFNGSFKNLPLQSARRTVSLFKAMITLSARLIKQ
ncbi:hypothetical protein [Paenibacillus gyeongsangnamensis]|uniref:hypothetical protein n=1 Tax=Paenibacillus gyeongsangnamensis TaxID=3388067 RepID=UPI0022B90605|nr:hypothetical protein [Paenibacillus filicis]